MMLRRQPAAARRAGGSRRITYICQHFTTPDEAGGRRDWEFARRLAADGHAVTMICGGEQGRRYRIAGFDVVQVASPYTNRMSPARRIGSFVQFMAKATLVAARTPADVVLASSTPLTVAVPGVVAARLRRAPFVFEVRDLWPHVPVALGYLSGVPATVARWLEAWAYRNAAHVIPLSPGMADGVRAVEPSVPITVVPNASDFDAYAATEEERQRVRAELGWDATPVIVYAGSFGPIHDVRWSVELAGRLRDDPVRLVLLGEGASSDGLRTRAGALGLDAAALLPGKVSNAEAVRYVVGADAVLSTVMDHEALRPASINKFFDACAAGRPILLNHGGWLTDLAVRHGAGWRLDRDVTVAADQVRELLADPDALRRAGGAAAELGRRHFARDDLYDAWAAAVTGATRGRRRAARPRRPLPPGRGRAGA